MLIIQQLIDSSAEMELTTAMDMMLLIIGGGRRPRRRHLEDLIARSGLELDEIRPTQNSLSVLCARVPNQTK